jgi:hypothetical protein
MMGARSSGASNVGSTQGGAKAVQFSRAVTAADTAFATITVTLPRSSTPIAIKFTISAGTALVQVQGNGVELYGDQVGPNIPTVLPLPGFPETTSVNVQVEQLAASTIAGSLFYN